MNYLKILLKIFSIIKFIGLDDLGLIGSVLKIIWNYCKKYLCNKK